MRIGIYGGTFNPIHKTHLEIAHAAVKQFNLDILYFLVAGTPPHKSTAESIADSCRYEMVKLAIAGEPKFNIDARELYRSGKSYSYITMTELKEEHPYDDIFFIMGSDSLLNFKNWVKPFIISECATILVAPRSGDDLNLLERAIFDCKNQFDGDFFLINYKPNSLSSSVIRRDFYKHSKDLRQFLPDAVYTYIEQHNLYNPFSYSYDDVLAIAAEMKKELKYGRYIHTLGVAQICYSLAIKWSYPAITAMIAGMLHDSAKCLSDEKRINICNKNNIPITKIEHKYPHLLHGKVGAFFCESKYGIKDKQIAHAIAVHTTGCPAMNLLDKIVFVADYIEPMRDKQPRLDILRFMAYEDLDSCVYMILEDSVAYLNKNPQMVDPTTIETYEYYKNYMKERGK